VDRVGSSPPVGDRVRRLAADMGILPSDPLAPVLDELAKLPAELREQLGPVIARIEGTASTVSDRVEADAADRLYRKAMAELPRAVDRLSLQMYWRNIVYAALILIVGMMATFWFGDYWGHLIDQNCAAQDGGVACSGWWRLPPR
jgi:hypothetical protein